MDVKAAIVHDALPFHGGAERTLEAMRSVLPEAPVFTLVHNPAALRGIPLEGADIRPSWLNRLPGVHADHYRYFPLFPAAVRSFDLSEFDLVVASHYAVAGWVRLRPGQRLLNYMYTPLRYLWQDAGRFRAGLPKILRPAVAAGQIALRIADRRAARRADRLLAISAWIAGLASRAYGREVDVLYPPVDLGRFRVGREPRSGFVCLTRLARHKHVDAVIAAFNRLQLPLDVIGDGPERTRLEELAGATVRFLGRLPDADVAYRLATARALVHMAPEDFGIAVLEAQAAGCPVIAVRGGANPETVQDGVTGLLVDGHDDLAASVERFIEIERQFDPEAIRANAERFSAERFKEGFRRQIESLWQK